MIVVKDFSPVPPILNCGSATTAKSVVAGTFSPIIVVSVFAVALPSTKNVGFVFVAYSASPRSVIMFCRLRAVALPSTKKVGFVFVAYADRSGSAAFSAMIVVSDFSVSDPIMNNGLVFLAKLLLTYVVEAKLCMLVSNVLTVAVVAYEPKSVVKAYPDKSPASTLASSREFNVTAVPSFSNDKYVAPV